jgi:capsular polysaccharide biosynthesis protein
MYVLAKQENATPTNGDLQASTMLTKDYAELIKSRDVTETVISELGLNMTSEQLLDKMEISTPADTRVLAIKITDPDPYKAREIADAVRNVAAEHIQKVMNIEAVNVVEQANIPKNPQGPNVTKNGIVGALLGAIVAIAVVLVIYMTNDTIKTSDDVEKYLNLSTLGVIPLAEDEPKSKKRKIKKNKKNKKRNGGRGR